VIAPAQTIAMPSVIFVAEGDATTPTGSGSGTPYAIAQALRSSGVRVETVDAELYGMRKLLTAAASWAPNRATWRAKYRLSARAFAARSVVAQRGVRALLRKMPDAVVIQYGAGCLPVRPGDTQLFLYCDNFVKHTLANAFSNASQLTPRDCDTAIRNEAMVYDRAQHIFTMSEYIRGRFISEGLVTPEKISPVYAGYPFVEGAQGSAQGVGGTRRVLFVGRDWTSKGGPELLDAFRDQRQTYGDLRLAILGPPVQPAETVGVDGVEFYGFLDKSIPEQRETLRDVYSGSTIFALPTHYDSFPISVLEAMSYGLPVILTNTGALPEMVISGTTGISVSPGDRQGLSRALAALLADPAAAQRMGAAGLERARRLFTWQSVANTMCARIWPGFVRA